jgi:hypothetical protein
MAANKQQLDDIISHRTGLPLADVAAVTDALPDAFGEWMKDNGSTGSGLFEGEAFGLELKMTRTGTPAPGQWLLSFEAAQDFLTDFGDGSSRFLLPVVNG